MSEEKRRVLELAERYVCPGRVRTFRALGVDLVIGRREGYRIWDLDGRELIDLHLNGGVFNLGHRNPELIATLKGALDTLDVGNHHFPSAARAELGEALARLTPGDLQYSVFASGGGEAIDLALKTARHATKRRKIVSIAKGYHGHTGLALAAGDERFSRMFLSEGPPGEFVQVPWNDLDAMASALSGDDVAAVVLETIPATLGFPLPAPGYLARVKALCKQHGALYVADEVQTGLGRTGTLWAVEQHDVEPDILVTGKGLSGGLYPIAATVLSRRVAGWLDEDGWGHVSTFGGAEVGCRVAQRVLEITTRPAVDREREGGVAASGRRARGDPSPPPRVVRRDPPRGSGDGAALRGSAGRDADDARALRVGPVGDVRRLRSVRVAVQAGPARGCGALRRDAGALRGRRGALPGLAGLNEPDVLARFEAQLDPARPEAAPGVAIIGYGEVSTVFALAELPGRVCKRMAGFRDGEAAAALHRSRSALPRVPRSRGRPRRRDRDRAARAARPHAGGLPGPATTRCGGARQPSAPLRRRRPAAGLPRRRPRAASAGCCAPTARAAMVAA